MAWDDVKEAIYAKAETVLTAYVGERPNQAGFEKPNDDLWYRLSIKPAASETVAISTKNEYRISGLLIVQIFVPVGSDEAASDAVAALLLTSFDYITIDVGDSEGSKVVFDSAPGPPIDIGRVGGQYQTNVNLDWQVDFDQT